MKKAILSVIILGVSALYVVSRSSAPAAPPALVSGRPTSQPLPAPTLPPGPAPAPIPKPLGSYRDGSYTGPSVDAYYGYVQVQAIISDGKLSDVSFLAYPNDRDTSRYINSQAMPYLTQEAIQAQNANVDIISGATDTSLAFRQSLASALASAKRS